MKGFPLSLLLILICISCKKPTEEPQRIPVEFSKLYGGTDVDKGLASVYNTDGSIVIVGDAFSNNNDFAGSGSGHSGIIKVNADGTIAWKYKYDGISNIVYLNGIVKTSDGGYIVSGYGAGSTGEFANGNIHSSEGFVLKIDNNGNKVWSKVFGGTKEDLFYNVVTSSDGNYFLIGTANSTDGDLSQSQGLNDGWIVKIDGNGNKLFSKQYGGTRYDQLLNGASTPDGGLILVGKTESNDGDLTSRNTIVVSDDGWVLKIDANGNKIWSKQYGGSADDMLNAVIANSDGYLLVGSTESNDMDINNNHGAFDGWLGKIDQNGNLKWSKVFGGTKYEEIYSVCQATDGSGYLLAGYSESTNGDLSSAGNHGAEDAWILKVDLNGNKMISQCIGGNNTDNAFTITPVNNGKYYLTGFSTSNNYYVNNNHGLADIWLLAFNYKNDY